MALHQLGRQITDLLVNIALPGNSKAASDLPLKMLLALSAGLCLWVVYGIVKQDWVIILVNSTGATLSLAGLGPKIRDSNS